MKNDDIRLAIAIPVYRGQDYLPHALLSIIKQEVEVDVYIYDNSPDLLTFDSIKLYLSARIFYSKNETNLGYLGNMNRCLELATSGKYTHIAILHHDDFHIGESIKNIIHWIKYNQGLGIYYSSACKADQYGNYDANNAKTTLRKFEAGESAISACWDIPCSACVYASKAIENVGYLNKNYPYSAEIEHYARIGRKYGILRLPEPIAAMRLHDKNYRYKTWCEVDFVSTFSAMISQLELYYGATESNSRILAVNRHAGTFVALSLRMLFLGKPSAAYRLIQPVRDLKLRWKTLKAIFIGLLSEFAPKLFTLLKRIHR
jgi:glycosyltransferase involved in cell wall biosynthesis